MLINFHFLVDKYKINLKGVLHIGAHECEEMGLYEHYISRNKILWIEALEDKVELNRDRHPGILIEQAIVNDCVEEVMFNRSNNGQSSSFLEFDLHSQYHPDVIFVSSYGAKTTKTETILDKYPSLVFNFLNLDIQGAELRALRGMEKYLKNVDYVYTEVNDDSVYKGCCQLDELDSFLSSHGFERKEIAMTNAHWGDAFYVRVS